MMWFFLMSFKQIGINMFGNYLPHVNKRIETKITSKGSEQPLEQSTTRGTNGEPIDSINDTTNSPNSPDKGKLANIDDTVAPSSSMRVRVEHFPKDWFGVKSSALTQVNFASSVHA